MSMYRWNGMVAKRALVIGNQVTVPAIARASPFSSFTSSSSLLLSYSSQAKITANSKSAFIRTFATSESTSGPQSAPSAFDYSINLPPSLPYDTPPFVTVGFCLFLGTLAYGAMYAYEYYRENPRVNMPILVAISGLRDDLTEDEKNELKRQMKQIADYREELNMVLYRALWNPLKHEKDAATTIRSFEEMCQSFEKVLAPFLSDGTTNTDVNVQSGSDEVLSQSEISQLKTLRHRNFLLPHRSVILHNDSTPIIVSFGSGEDSTLRRLELDKCIEEIQSLRDISQSHPIVMRIVQMMRKIIG